MSIYQQYLLIIAGHSSVNLELNLFLASLCFVLRMFKIYINHYDNYIKQTIHNIARTAIYKFTFI